MIKFIYRRLRARFAGPVVAAIYCPSTESVRVYEEENRNRARLAGYQSTNQSRKINHER